MFFSKEQLEVSIKRLGELDPFFGTVFLALKQANLPVGETKPLKFLPLLEVFLQKFYRPAHSYNKFYMPFKTYHKKHWMTLQHAQTLKKTRTANWS